MYYYIFDPPRGAKEYERTAQIKEYLSVLGIAGEMTTPQPGKRVEDLVNLAVNKRYSTVVAVGGMELINKVARSLEPHDIVFGIIPSLEHLDINDLIGVHDWKSAAEQLKKRRWQEIRLGLLNNQSCFLTPATISIPGSVSFQIKTPDFSLKGQGGTITIMPVRNQQKDNPGLNLRITPGSTSGSILQRLFKTDKQERQLTHIIVPSAEIETDRTLAVVVAGTSLASTPVTCTTQEKVVKLIIARGSTHP